MGHPGPQLVSHAAIATWEQLACNRQKLLASNHVMAMWPIHSGEQADVGTLRRHHVIQVWYSYYMKDISYANTL